ncbi:MAG: hypothetical protein J0H99_22290 [Rhodospirillales bacterium]|nr:hypothetical protein [Rhodospirillales bacterium]
MARTLSERMRAHEQQKAKLAQRFGEIAGLLDLDSNALYGALLSLRDGADDKTQVEK